MPLLIMSLMFLHAYNEYFSTEEEPLLSKYPKNANIFRKAKVYTTLKYIPEVSADSCLAEHSL